MSSTILNTTIQQARDNLRKEKEEIKKEKERIHNIKHSARTDSTLYNTKQWKKLRNWYIMQHPCCEIHLKHGIVKPAQAIHHAIPFMLGATEDEQKKLFYSVDNLMALCNNCHKQVHAEQHWNDGKLDDCIPYELIEY